MNFLKSYRKNRPLSFQLLTKILIYSAIITCVVVAIQLGVFFQNDINSIKEQSLRIQNTILSGLNQSVWNFNEEQILAQLEGLVSGSDISFAQVVISNADGSENIIKAGDPNTTTPSIEVHHIELKFTDTNGREYELGTLITGTDFEPAYKNLLDNIMFVIVLQFSKTFIMAVVILWIIQQLVTRHLTTIRNYTGNMSLKNLERKLELDDPLRNRQNELDDIVAAFNTMRVNLLEDVETQRKMEREIVDKELERVKEKSASIAKGKFLAMMSHEIRTPLNGIMGISNILRDTKLDDKQQYYLKLIDRSGQSLLSIINDILDYSKIEAGKVVLENIPINLRDLLENTLANFSGNNGNEEIELLGEIESNVPTNVIGDSNRLQQIVSNFISNSLKFTHSGTISFTIHTTDKSSDKFPVIAFSVKDTGIGIAENVQAQLFGEFSQADISTTRLYGGTGLGLYICKHLSNLMEGDVHLESEPGVGSHFWIEIPMQVNTLALSPQLQQDEEIAQILPGKRILLIATHDALRESLQINSEEWGISTTVAADQQAALMAIENSIRNSEIFDLITIDCPQGYGPMIDAIRSRSEYQTSPLLFLTDAGTPIGNSERHGIHSILYKPIAMHRFRHSVAQSLGLSRIIPRENTIEELAIASDNLKVLVVEDNSVNQIVITGLLRKLGIVPKVVNDGLEAVDAVKSVTNQFDLILMDCEMPNMDGFEASALIRQHEQDNNLPAVKISALTAHVTGYHKTRIHQYGMDYYLSKPVTLAALKTCLLDMDFLSLKHIKETVEDK